MLGIASSLLLAPAAQHAHASTTQQCSCAQHETDHPFTIDCSNPAPIRAATVTLETTCATATAYEWGGVFTTGGAASLTWVAQAVGSPRAWADPTMNLAVFSVDTADKTHLLEKATTAASLMAGTCTVVNTGDTIPAPTAAGACYTLTFPTATTTDFNAPITLTGVSNVAFFSAHGPTEFERDTHYFMSTDLATDIEPVAQTDGQEYNCRYDATSAGLKTCAQAFFIIQAHHDYCPHDTLTRYEEELFHTWESKCVGCSIVRRYDSTLRNCPVIDCTDTTVAQLGYQHLFDNCIRADTTYPHEWAAVFDTPANAYTWVSQAATPFVNATTNYTYADAEMKIVAFANPNNARSHLHGQQDLADALFTNGPCPIVTATCVPGAASCSSAPTITPTATGVCATIQFPDSTATLVDFHANVVTTNAAHVAFFTAHVPTEFERDMHYFMSTDLATDIEPAANLGAAATHDHSGRRLSIEGDMRNDRRSRRRLANSGSCCNNATQQGAWKQVVAYHDLCDHSQVPTYIEVGFHDYEASCENYFCNLIGPNVDQTVCPFPPPSPPASPPTVIIREEDEMPVGGLVAIIVAGVLVVALGICLCFMYSREKQGKPVFTNIETARAGKTPNAVA